MHNGGGGGGGVGGGGRIVLLIMLLILLRFLLFLAINQKPKYLSRVSFFFFAFSLTKAIKLLIKKQNPELQI